MVGYQIKCWVSTTFQPNLRGDRPLGGQKPDSEIQTTETCDESHDYEQNQDSDFTAERNHRIHRNCLACCQITADATHNKTDARYDD